MIIPYRHKITGSSRVVYFFCICLLLALATACNRGAEKADKERLNQIETFLESNPQQALQVLSDVQSTLLNEADYAYYTLLKVRAWDITGKNIGMLDTLILPYRNYFLDKQNAPKAALACFVTARVYEAKGNIPQALYNYLIADDWAKKANKQVPCLYYFKIPYNISVLYNLDKKYTESIEYLDVALTYMDNNAELDTNYIYRLYALLLKGVNLKNINEFDKATTCYNQALDIAERHNDITSKNQILYNNCILLYTTNKHDIAKVKTKELLSTIAINDTLNLKRIYITLGYIYNNTNQIDSATLYIDKAKSLSTKNEYIVQLSLYDLISKVSLKKGNTLEAKAYQQKYTELKAEQQNIRKAQEDALKAERAQQKELLTENMRLTQSARISLQKQAQQKLLITLLSVILLGGVTVLLYIHIRNRRERHWIKTIREYGKKEMMKSQLQRDDLLAVMEWTDQFIENGKTPSIDDFYKLMEMLDNMYILPHWLTSSPFLELNYGNMFKNLRKDFPMLTDKEFKICSLIVTQLFSKKEIMGLMRISEEEFDTLKTSIEHKMEIAGYHLDDLKQYAEKLSKVPPQKQKLKLV